MCNLNILFHKKKIDITGFIQSVTSNSFTRNKDGEGFYCDYENTFNKDLNKINYNNFPEINKSNVVISHQRLSTSGFSVKYNHPFINKDFVMVHNGIINQFKEGKKQSDSKGFFDKFNKQFKKYSKNNNREQSILKSIKKLFKNDLGSYSIMFYDRKTENSYYFKDSYTRINFYKNKDFLYITTLEDNELFLNLLDYKEFDILNIKSNKIYKINKNQKVESLGCIRVEVEKNFNQNPTTPINVEVEVKNNFESEVKKGCKESYDLGDWDYLTEIERKNLEGIRKEKRDYENFTYVNKSLERGVKY